MHGRRRQKSLCQNDVMSLIKLISGDWVRTSLLSEHLLILRYESSRNLDRLDQVRRSWSFPSSTGRLMGHLGFLSVDGNSGGTSGKEPACQRRRLETWFSFLGWEDPLEGMASHSSILAWRTPWSEEPGGLESMRAQTVRLNWSNLARTQAQANV